MFGPGAALSTLKRKTLNMAGLFAQCSVCGIPGRGGGVFLIYRLYEPLNIAASPQINYLQILCAYDVQRISRWEYEDFVISKRSIGLYCVLNDTSRYEN